MNNKIKLGIFVLAGLAAVLVSMVAVGSFSLNKRYTVYVLFDNASGLTKKAKVKIAGVEIGVLRGIDLQGTKARLRLAIQDDVKLYQDASASIVSMGIIGTKYIDVNPGDSSLPAVKNGDMLSTSKAPSLEEKLGQIAEKISSAIDSLGKDGKNGDMIDNLAQSIRDLKSIMHNIALQNSKITSAINNINKFSYNLADIADSNKRDIREAVLSMKEAAAKLDAVMTKINEGEGAFAALINDEQMGRHLKETVSTAKDAVASAKTAIDGLSETFGEVNKLQLYWDYMGRYDAKDEKLRSDLGIGISMRKERFYYVGVSNAADAGNEKDKEEKDRMNTLTALLGFRGEHAQIYGGVMRNKAGVGVGYSFFDPIYAPHRRLQVHFDAFNFPRKNKPPEFNAGVRFGITRWFYVGISVEDIAYKASLTPYVKLEIKDTDISRLLGIAGVAAAASK